MKTKIIYSVCLFMLFFIITFSGCKQTLDTSIIPVNYTDEIAQLVSYVPSNYVFLDSSLIIRFTKPVIAQSSINKKINDSLLHFKPSFKFDVIWKDNQTLEIQPKKSLEPNTNYVGTLKLNQINPDFKSLSQHLQFQFTPVYNSINILSCRFIDEENSENIRVSGKIQFAKDIDYKDLQDGITLKAGGKTIPILVDIDTGADLYTFLSEPFGRKNNETKVVVQIESKKFHLEKNIEKEYTLYPADVFKPLKINALSQVNSAIVRITFTNPIGQGQDLDGYVNVEPALDYKVKAIDNNLYLIGDFKYSTNYEVTINKGLQSANSDVRYMNTFSANLQIRSKDPDIEYSSNGVFLPSSMNQNIYFKTVNITKARIIIKKVYEQNLMFFLQTQNLKSTKNRDEAFHYWELERVGVTVAEQEFAINNKADTWLQHELNLSSLIKKGDKGLYIMLMYFNNSDIAGSNETETNDEFDSYDDYDDYYYPANRKIIKDAYRTASSYYVKNKIFKALIVSDIGLIAKDRGDKVTVYALNVLNGQPMDKTLVKLYSYQNKILGEKETDKKGSVTINKEKEDVFYITAEKNGQRSIIKFSEMAWNLSSFDIGGKETQKGGIKAFLYTERGVYRPGEKINLSVIARNSDNTFPSNHPVTLELYNPKNQLIKSVTSKTSEDGFYSFALSTRTEDMTGNWMARLKIGNSEFSQTIKIETIVPYTVKLVMSINKDKLSKNDRDVSIKMQAKYLTGLSFSNANAQISYKITPVDKRFNAFSNYSFTNVTKKFNEYVDVLWEGSLDENGEISETLNIPNVNAAIPSALNVQIIGKVVEKSGRPVYNFENIPYDYYDYYVGHEVPKNKFLYIDMGKKFAMNSIVVDQNGKIAKNRKLKVTVYLGRSWWWWDYDSYDSFVQRFKSNSNTTKVFEDTVNSADKPFAVYYTPKDWGQHFIEITDESGHSTGQFFYASGWGKDMGDSEAASILMLKSDKDAYIPGDKALISFTAPSKGKVLLTIEKGFEIMHSQWYEVSVNKINEMVIPLKIDDSMTPNVYATLTLIQSHEETKNDRPIRMFGVIPIIVEDKSTKNGVSLSTPAAIKPNSNFSIGIQTLDKQKTQFTIAVVDEGILDLTNYKTPDPWKEFYGKQRLGVLTYDLYDFIISALRGDVFSKFSIGGDLEKSMRESQLSGAEKIQRFKLVSMFKGPLFTNDKGYAEVKFTMPDYIGAVRVMVVAANGKKFASADKVVPVKADLMVMLNLPRFVRPGDVIKIPVSVLAMKENMGNVTVKLDVSGPAEITQGNSKSLSMQSMGEKDVYFTVKIKEEVGELLFKATATSNAYTDSKQTEMGIIASNPRIHETTEFIVRKGQNKTISFPDKAVKGTIEMVISIMRKPKLNLRERLMWLIQYPYGCVEQTTSAVFPQLYLKNFMKINASDEKRIDNNINEGIRRLRNFQLSNGSFTYWPGAYEYYTSWSTNYAGHFLVEAKKLGYPVPDDMLKNWINFQKAQSKNYNEDLLTQVYRLYLLALSGNPQLSSMNYIRENTMSKMGNPERWMLAAAYSLAGQSFIAAQISKSAKFNVKDYWEFTFTYGSTLRDKAIILNSLVDMERYEDSSQLYDEITNVLASNNWYSTQTTGFMLLSVGKYLQKMMGEKLPKIKGYIELQDKRKISFEGTEFKYSHKLSETDGSKAVVYIDESSEIDFLYVQSNWSGIPIQPETAAIDKNIGLETNWYDEDGNFLEPSEITQGTTFWLHIRVINKYKSPIEEVALIQLLPSGWEVQNMRVTGESLPEFLKELFVGKEEYYDIRDDRVMWFFKLDNGYYYHKVTYLDFVLKLNAVTVGEYDLPPTYAEAMYNNAFNALLPGFPVKVTE